MKHKLTLLFVIVVIVFTACSSPGSAPAPTQESIPIVIADDTVIAEGRVEPIRYAEIAFTASGTVGDILVAEGDHVKKGESLIRLGDEMDSNFAAAQLELANAQHALDDLINARDADLAEATIQLKDAKEKFERAENYLHYLQTSQRIPQTDTRVILVQTWKGYQYEYKIKNFKGPAPKDWIIEAENDLALKKARFDEAQHAVDCLKDGPNADELPLVQARLDAAKAAVTAFVVTAPFDGVVAELHATTGSSINAGETAVTIADFSSWIVKTSDVTEIDIVKLSEDQTVTVTLDAIPDVVIKGKILSIGDSFSQNQGDIVYEITILLMEKIPELRWGMTAVVKFE